MVRKIGGMLGVTMAILAAHDIGLHETYDRYKAKQPSSGERKAFQLRKPQSKPSEFENEDWWVDSRKRNKKKRK